jgi:hypothetical protein
MIRVVQTHFSLARLQIYSVFMVVTTRKSFRGPRASAKQSCGVLNKHSCLSRADRFIWQTGVSALHCHLEGIADTRKDLIM